MKSEKQIRVKLIYTTVADSRGNGVALRLNRTLLDRCQINLLIPIYKNGPEGNSMNKLENGYIKHKIS